MMKRALTFVLALGLVGSVQSTSDARGDGGGSRKPRAARDANKRTGDSAQAEAAARKVFEHVMAQEDVAASIAQQEGVVGDLCAIGVIPGPRNSFDIRLSIMNVGSADIGFVNVDSFLGLGANSLVQDSVFDTLPPAGGSLSVEYPATGGGVGPAVLSFTGFGPLLGAAFNLDPDTYDDPDFSATVLDMNRTLIEVAYDDGRRCRGFFGFQVLANASVAFITQTSP
jgi:hypothetical protein